MLEERFLSFREAKVIAEHRHRRMRRYGGPRERSPEEPLPRLVHHE